MRDAFESNKTSIRTSGRHLVLTAVPRFQSTVLSDNLRILLRYDPEQKDSGKNGKDAMFVRAARFSVLMAVARILGYVVGPLIPT